MLSIGLDVGTQGTKCIVYDADTKKIEGRAAISYGLISERRGQAEQDPAVWVQVVSCSHYIEILIEDSRSPLVIVYCYPSLKLLSIPLI